MGNFKKIEVVGSTKKEALETAPFQILGDATVAYKNFLKDNVPTDATLKEFMLAYLQKKTKSAPGLGCYITIESASKNTKTRCYKIMPVKNEKGTRRYQSTFIVLDKDKKDLGQIVGTMAKAKEYVKELYRNGLTEKVTVKKIKTIKDGEEVVFTAEYSPSVNTKEGKYLVFGIVND